MAPAQRYWSLIRVENYQFQRVDSARSIKLASRHLPARSVDYGYCSKAILK